jgi:hypothetical protein
MNKFFLLSFIGISFKSREVLKQIKELSNYEEWNVKTTEQIGDRGIVLQIKNRLFDGFVLVTVDFDEKYVIRTLNKCGFTLGINKTNDISNLEHIIKF